MKRFKLIAGMRPNLLFILLTTERAKRIEDIYVNKS